jgi:hypothetical protein
VHDNFRTVAAIDGATAIGTRNGKIPSFIPESVRTAVEAGYALDRGPHLGLQLCRFVVDHLELMRITRIEQPSLIEVLDHPMGNAGIAQSGTSRFEV